MDGKQACVLMVSGLFWWVMRGWYAHPSGQRPRAWSGPFGSVDACALLFLQ